MRHLLSTWLLRYVFIHQSPIEKSPVTDLQSKVLLITFIGPRHARVLQTYYNGTELIIHQSKLIGFTEGKNIAGLQFLTWFAASSPVGDTSEEKPRVKWRLPAEVRLWNTLGTVVGECSIFSLANGVWFIGLFGWFSIACAMIVTLSSQSRNLYLWPNSWLCIALRNNRLLYRVERCFSKTLIHSRQQGFTGLYPTK